MLGRENVASLHKLIYNIGIVIQRFKFNKNMAQIKRYLEEKIIESLKKDKIVIIYGARQVGKTTLVKKFLGTEKSLYINGDFIDDAEKLDKPTKEMVSRFENVDILVIDEAQNIKDIGLKLKVIHDTLPNLKIIATGSSSFELSNKISEPLTGRHFSHLMYPFSFGETKSHDVNIKESLIYGMYPDVFLQKTTKGKKEIIERIASSYLFKDLLNIEYIKNPKSLEYLLKVLASQIGNEVSYNEISNTLDIDTKTVMKYIDILEKLFIIFSLNPLSSNTRKSLTKKRKYYFYDLGIRNAILGDFSEIENRNDKGALWENFCIVERLKRNSATDRNPRYYFFRTYQGDEIDFIEIDNTMVSGFEFKYTKDIVSNKIRKMYKEDLDGQGEIQIINTETFENFI